MFLIQYPKDYKIFHRKNTKTFQKISVGTGCKHTNRVLNFWRQFLDMNQKTLQNIVIEPPSRLNILHNSLQIVQDNQRSGRFKSVVKALYNKVNLIQLRLSNQIFGIYHLNERESRILRKFAGDGCFTGPHLPKEDDRGGLDRARGNALEDI